MRRILNACDFLLTNIKQVNVTKLLIITAETSYTVYTLISIWWVESCHKRSAFECSIIRALEEKDYLSNSMQYT